VSQTRARARDMLPTVLLTLLSIVQAVSLEALGERLVEVSHLFVGDLPAWVLGLQAAAIFQGIILIWVFYTSILMRFRWVPTLRDSILPFLLGAIEIALVALVGTRFVALWLCLFGLIFALAIWTSRSMFQRARADDYNRRVTMEMGGESVAGRAVGYIFVASFFILGGVVQWAGPKGALAIVALVVTNLACSLQLLQIRGDWNASIAEPPEPAQAD